ncbi:hypothetical protein HAX54_023293 [Datura stramonium]|uniref:Uncharacterized protein n=1 Tax=Datura stramonium TaxID=4076 RepID=A0ABS8S4R6_DATST|nr:hypothetical protein [Datura stramonium]
MLCLKEITSQVLDITATSAENLVRSITMRGKLVWQPKTMEIASALLIGISQITEVDDEVLGPQNVIWCIMYRRCSTTREMKMLAASQCPRERTHLFLQLVVANDSDLGAELGCLHSYGRLSKVLGHEPRWLISICKPYLRDIRC